MIAQFGFKEKRGTLTQKDELRRLMLAKRVALSPEEIVRMGRRAEENMIRSDPWGKSRAPALYAALPDEVPTRELMKAAWQSGKTVLLPKIIDKKARRMIFVVCAKEEDTRKGAFGILEPIGDEEGAPDFIIAPGLAFDEKGYRVGYGGGYYDRYLASLPVCPPLAGLCFDFQIVSRAPSEATDIPVNFLCAPAGFKCL